LAGAQYVTSPLIGLGTAVPDPQAPNRDGTASVATGRFALPCPAPVRHLDAQSGRPSIRFGSRIERVRLRREQMEPFRDSASERACVSGRMRYPVCQIWDMVPSLSFLRKALGLVSRNYLDVELTHPFPYQLLPYIYEQESQDTHRNTSPSYY